MFSQKRYRMVNEQMKKGPASLTLGKWKLRAKWDPATYLLKELKLKSLTAFRTVEQLKPLCIASRNKKYINYYGTTLTVSYKAICTLPYDSTIPFLSIYPRGIKHVYIKTGSPVFLTALFITAKKWKQPKCPSNGKWINKLCHVICDIPICI